MKAAVDKPLLYTPDDAIIGHWYSSMNSNSASGTDLLTGVNPANGVVLYYHLPQNVTDTTVVSLEIRDSKGELVRSLSSNYDPKFQVYDGGPSPEPVLSVKKGINRFVWDMRYPTMPGIPTAYIESSFRGHKVIPGEYSFHIKSDLGDSQVKAKLIDNPLFETNEQTYQEYHAFMMTMEKELTGMHHMVNKAMDYQQQLKTFLDKIKGDESRKSLATAGQQLLKEMQAWDEDMVQRKSLAYDDVENFPNKFTANYLFLINQTESAIPKVNQGSRERYEELTKQWAVLKAEGERILNTAVPAYNNLLKEARIGLLFAL
jgi:hypothetical protein